MKIALSLLLIIFAGANLSGAQDGIEDKTPLLSDLDIPLMQGFQEDENSRVVFDTPEGRIIEVQARGQKGHMAVMDYYNMLLPSLGWRLVVGQEDSCGNQDALCIKARRDGEVLTIEIKKEKGVKKGSKEDVFIYFAVNPE